MPIKLKDVSIMIDRYLELIESITSYLATGGLWNPELAEHLAVRDLLIDCRKALQDAVNE
jgi:hypothetical protein